MFFGKDRSLFGEYLDREKIKQSWLASDSGVTQTTISQLASGKRKNSNMETWRKIQKSLKKIGKNPSYDDFW